VHAFVTLRDGDVAIDALTAYCKARLSDYKVPESFTISASPLPRNANGKLLKRALRDQASVMLPVEKVRT
jgi:acyl-CoA synthetase (AMP-forming)/AMP-acid ligase II